MNYVAELQCVECSSAGDTLYCNEEDSLDAVGKMSCSALCWHTHSSIRDTIRPWELRGCVFGSAAEKSRLVHVNNVPGRPVRSQETAGTATVCVVINLEVRCQIWRLVPLLGGIHPSIHDTVGVINAPQEAECRLIDMSGVTNVETRQCGCIRGRDRHTRACTRLVTGSKPGDGQVCDLLSSPWALFA